ncbi:hypothetical protein TIFTF001_016668 [Ficus carica]|uniref:Uncharacterized protein n=1 Tax=Ficus carica TaxID=3494 RepID=A0AA88A6P5_FICCA|nr:hypothetical protein TIFTF001_016668 [Ficus carica]
MIGVEAKILRPPWAAAEAWVQLLPSRKRSLLGSRSRFVAPYTGSPAPPVNGEQNLPVDSIGALDLPRSPSHHDRRRRSGDYHRFVPSETTVRIRKALIPLDVGVFTEKIAEQTTGKTRSIHHRSRKNKTAPQSER